MRVNKDLYLLTMKNLFLSVTTIFTISALVLPVSAGSANKKYHSICFADDDQMICDNKKIWIIPDGTLITLIPSAINSRWYEFSNDTKSKLKKVTSFEAMAITNKQRTIMYSIREQRVGIYRPGRGEQLRLGSCSRIGCQFRAGDITIK